MVKQGDKLVAALNRMSEIKRIQMNALQEMLRSLGLFFSRQGRQAKPSQKKSKNGKIS